MTCAFLSTLSLRRATLISTKKGQVLSLFLSTLSLRRATIWTYQRYFAVDISIHALLAESDLQRQIEFERYSDISIHALLAESDKRQCLFLSGIYRFLSTLSLRRATICRLQSAWLRGLFLSTLSLRRATSKCKHLGIGYYSISIHALLAESDSRRPLWEELCQISIHALLAESDAEMV